MKRLRRLLVALSPAVAVLFALCVAVPRSGLVYHVHAGGEHQHVHAEDADWLAALIEHRHEHTHEHGSEPQHGHDGLRPSPTTRSNLPMLASGDDTAAGHWHQQDRFHRAVAARATVCTAVAPIGDAPPSKPVASLRGATLDLHARGPPHLSLS